MLNGACSCQESRMENSTSADALPLRSLARGDRRGKEMKTLWRSTPSAGRVHWVAAPYFRRLRDFFSRHRTLAVRHVVITLPLDSAGAFPRCVHHPACFIAAFPSDRWG